MFIYWHKLCLTRTNELMDELKLLVQLQISMEFPVFYYCGDLCQVVSTLQETVYTQTLLFIQQEVRYKVLDTAKVC